MGERPVDVDLQSRQLDIKEMIVYNMRKDRQYIDRIRAIMYAKTGKEARK
jgi:hypothetical protein